ncbi:MAG: patatin family protein [Coprococcus sp.]
MLDINVKDVSLVLEGGTFRTVFTMGILDAFLDAGIIMPYVSGVSAGITYAGSYIAQQRGRNIHIIRTYRRDKRYMGVRNFLTDRSLFGLKFAYDRVTNELVPFDWQSFRDYKGTMCVGVTNARTGEIEYMDGLKMDKSCRMLQATCAIPMLFPAIEINGQYYYDGGVCEPITIRKAEQDGYQKHIIIMTRVKGYVKEQDRSNIMAARWMKRKYPNMVRPLLTRHDYYNAQVAYCEELEERGQALLFRPDYALASMEKDLQKLQDGYDMGYRQATERMEEIRAFCGFTVKVQEVKPKAQTDW